MEHRLAEFSDIDRILEIIGDAQSFMKLSGVDQWQNGYPNREAFESDIQNGGCHVFLIDGRIAGLISIFFENEASYAYVEAGAWLTENASYSVFHRAAVGSDYRDKGIASQMLSYAESVTIEKGFKSIRGDTHRDNKAMRRLLEKRGFVHCGTIYLDKSLSDGSERVCYEKLL